MLAWMLVLVGGIAYADGPSDEQIHIMVEKLANKNLPKDTTCTRRPELPAVFRLSVPVAIRGSAGCTLKGVVIGTAIRGIDGAASLSIKESVWEGMSSQERADALRAWTNGVLLAFAQPEGEGTVKISRGKAIVQNTWLHRAEGGGISARSTGTFTFSLENGALEGQSATPQQYWHSALAVRPEKLTGNLTTENVSAGINTYGKVVSHCFRDYYEDQDLTYDGRVRVSWTVGEGKASNWGVVGEDNPPEQLYKCYINQALAQVEWPLELAGDVTWVFAVTRAEHKPD